MASLALLGKHPAHGDFLRRGWPDGSDARLMAWLDATLSAIALRAGPDWGALYRSAPALGFWIGPAVLGVGATGALIFSNDRVGRPYPLLLAALDAAVLPPPLHPGQELVMALLARLRAADDTDAVAALTDGDPAPGASAEFPPATLWASRRDGDLAKLLTEVCLMDHASAAGGRSYWWQAEPAGKSTALLAIPGLPHPEALVWLISEHQVASAEEGEVGS